MATVEEYIDALTPGQREQFERVRRIVRSIVPDAVYPTVGAVDATEGTKGTFRFTEEEPVPEAVVAAIVRHRVSQIDSGG